MDETATPMEEFCAALDCIVEDAMEARVSYAEMVGALTIKASAVCAASLGFYDDADSEDEDEEEV